MCKGTCIKKTKFLTSTANCGSCGHACPKGATCVNGACACPKGTTACFGACVNLHGGACMCPAPCGEDCCTEGETCCGKGCVDLTTSGANCGACGVVCPTNRVCQAGKCVCAGQTCGDHCCGSRDVCCGPGCCSQGGLCCGNRTGCCKKGGECCGDGCCDPGTICVFDVACFGLSKPLRRPRQSQTAPVGPSQRTRDLAQVPNR